MTEQEAIRTLFEQFTMPTGFLWRLQHGEGLDRHGLDQMWQALDVCRQAWAEQTCVPREAVLALTFIDEALPATFDLYPDLKSDLIDLYFQLIEQVTDTFASVFPPEALGDEEYESYHDFIWFWEDWAEQALIPERPLTEAEALAVLRHHLTGDGLIVALRCRMGAINRLGMAKAWFLLSQALETLGPLWAASPCIPKDIAMGLAQIREGITNGWTLYDFYPTIQQGLRQFADDLGAQGQYCLTERS